MLQTIGLFLLAWFAVSIIVSLLFGRLAELNAQCDDDIKTQEDTHTPFTDVA